MNCHNLCHPKLHCKILWGVLHKEAIFDFQMMFSSDAGISSTMYISTVLIYSGNPAAESEVSTETETDRAVVFNG